jgi:uncharacterized coiled-coil protein SlyX
MREGDDETQPNEHAIHRRLDLLSEQLRHQERILTEQNANIHELDGRIKSVEIEVAKGGRFPAWAGGLLVLAVAQIGAQIYLNGQIGSENSKLPTMEANCKALEARVNVQRDQVTDLAARMKGVEDRTTGGTHDRWTATADRERMADFQRWVESELRAIRGGKAP